MANTDEERYQGEMFIPASDRSEGLSEVKLHTTVTEPSEKNADTSPLTNGQVQDGSGASLDLKAGQNDEEVNSRGTWSRKLEYILTTIGFCVGLGNVLRFPYICIRNGGGAFLIPYLICLTVLGVPLFFLEVALGQFVAKGALHVWCICPLFKGIGITMIALSLMSAWCYTMMVSYTLIFACNAVKSPQPWTLCGQEWNSDSCVPPGRESGFYDSNNSVVNSGNVSWMGSNVTNTGNSTGEAISASKEFWLNNVLELSSGFENMGGLPWHTTLALFIATTAIFACVIKGVNSVGKVAYVTATLPYVLLTVLMIKGATLPGAGDGVLFYITPHFSKLLTIQTWVEGCIQVFYSLGPAYGSLISMASYNKFNNNCLRDAVLLSFICEGTSVFAGFCLFTILGHMAHTLNVHISKFAGSGPGLAFVVYPEAISYLPVPQLWGVLFFIMLFTIGLDSQFTLIETVLTALQDFFPRFMKRWNVIVKLVFALAFFLFSLPMASRGGMYLFQLVDWYFAAFTLLANGVLECVVVGWIYGAERMLDDVAMMIGRRAPYIFVLIWRFVLPVLLVVLMVTTLVTYQPPVYEGYVFGANAVAFGWCFASVSFLPIPCYSLYMLYKAKGSFMQRLKSTCTPSPEWRPREVSLREQYKHQTMHAPLCSFPLRSSRSKYSLAGGTTTS